MLEWQDVAAVLAARVEEARDVKRGRRRLCCARSAEVVLVYRVMYEGFKSLYQRVYRALRDGLLEGIPRVESLFPQGGVPPLGVSAPIQRE